MTGTEVGNLLNTDCVKKYRGVFRYHKSYFYTSGLTPETLIAKVKEKLPNAKIIDSGDHYAKFFGGAPSGSKLDSFMWVTFTL
jgi:hypothetical protein